MKSKKWIISLISIGIIIGILLIFFSSIFYINKYSVKDLYKDYYDKNDDSLINEDNNESDSKVNEEKPENKNTGKTKNTLIKIFNNLSGFCYNPDYPEDGPSKLDFIFDLEEISGKKIVTTINMSYDFFFSDDHYTPYDEEDTGDIFNITTKCKNITEGYCWESYYLTFPGGLYSGCRLFCDNSGEGIFYDTEWEFGVEISNCGNYSKYWRLGIFTEPDLGNTWNATFMVECLIVE